MMFLFFGGKVINRKGKGCEWLINMRIIFLGSVNEWIYIMIVLIDMYWCMINCCGSVYFKF